jgi:transcription antitermination factor NusG
MTNWYVLRVKPQKEFRAIGELRRSKHEAFVPSEKKYRRCGRNRQRVPFRYPLTPGYVMVGIEGSPQWSEIKGIDEVIAPLDVDGQPARLHPNAVDQLHAMGEQSTTIEIHKALKVGERVEVGHGPFKGHSAPLLSIRNGRAQIRLPLLGSEQTITIPVEYLDPG